MKSIMCINYLKRGRGYKYFNIKRFALTLIVPLFMTSCTYSQNNKKEQSASGNQPKIKIKVNKQYDDKGNVIGYDSIYSYSYSDSLNSDNHDTTVLHSFNFPNGQIPGNFNYHFNLDSIFKNDPFLNGDGFNNDPFSDFNFNTNPFDHMDKMMQQMDSIQKQMQQGMWHNFRFPNQPLIPAPSPQLPKKKIKPQPQPEPLPADTTDAKTKVI